MLDGYIVIHTLQCNKTVIRGFCLGFLFVLVIQLLSYDAMLCDPMDYSLPGSSVHTIFQARILKWVATSFSKGSSDPGINKGKALYKLVAEKSHWRIHCCFCFQTYIKSFPRCLRAGWMGNKGEKMHFWMRSTGERVKEEWLLFNDHLLRTKLP